MDECASDNECHANAQCTNTAGSYTCACLDGYAGDGKNCTGKRLYAAMIVLIVAFLKTVPCSLNCRFLCMKIFIAFA